ncbi:hypothetical protein N7532_000294 [Penicillium argentinense]|uniref:Uncharacterized protein n=1 Tax=Penicillium argentinense TaxID=1131581 RepID=A0A9W9G588_9EURO|nr:uncharacterized protein N7532_000294 [Penicillium argentinense]KAJ5112249.1 hypothetical protein N7532_000294 [Penicillium argentinense]
MRKISGMKGAVRAKKAALKGISFVRADGRPYGTITTTGDSGQQSLVSEYEITRGYPSRTLFGSTERNENVKSVFGEQVASMQNNGQGDGPGTVEFANGY